MTALSLRDAALSAVHLCLVSLAEEDGAVGPRRRGGGCSVASVQKCTAMPTVSWLSALTIALLTVAILVLFKKHFGCCCQPLPRFHVSLRVSPLQQLGLLPALQQLGLGVTYHPDDALA